MVTSIVRQDPCIELSRVDVDRPGPHYSVDTFRILKGEYRDARLFFLMGEDSLSDLPNWHKAKELVQFCSGICVMRRSRGEVDLTSLEKELSGLTDNWTLD